MNEMLMQAGRQAGRQACTGAMNACSAANQETLDNAGLDGEVGGGPGQALPVGDCGYSRRELEERMAYGTEPESAAELLARARIEASRLPHIFQADPDEVARAVRKATKQVAKTCGSQGDESTGLQKSIPSSSVASQNSLLGEDCATQWWHQTNNVWAHAKSMEQPIGSKDLDQSPSSSWRRETITGFSQLRQYICRWEDRFYDATCSGAELPQQKGTPLLPSKSDAEGWKELVSKNPPRVRLIMELDQKLAYKVFKDILSTLEEQQEDDEERRIDANIERSTNQVNANYCSWLYALVARIEKPLGVGVEAHLRALLRVLYSARNSNNLETVDVLICILEDYFQV